jgi:beta-lactamase class C
MNEQTQATQSQLSSPIRRGVITLLTTVCFFPAISQASVSTDKDKGNARAIVDKQIHALMRKHAIPGMAIAITINGQAQYFNYGVIDKESKIPVSENTLFELGSVSKTLTASLATYAAATGQLSLDDHPSRFWPQLKGSALDRATLKHLGTYTAGGLPLQVPEEVTEDKVLSYFQQWQALAPAGTQREYSNPSIGLFGRLAALALKSDFANAMETQLFPHLGMHHSYIRVPASEMSQYAWGHNSQNQKVRVNPGVLDAEAYGVKSSSTDVLRFVALNIDSSILDTNTQTAIKATQIPYFKIGKMQQGLGWEQYAYPISLQGLLAGNSEKMIWDRNPAKEIHPSKLHYAGRLFNKTGSTGGFGNYVLFVPNAQFGLVMLANKNYPIPDRIKAAYAILEGLSSKAQ